MSEAIGEERWDELSEEVKDYYRGSQVPHLSYRDVYAGYPMPGSVVNADGTLCKDYSFGEGRTEQSTITVHYPEVKEVPPRYDEHGYVTRPGLIPFPERDEEIRVSVFVPFTPEEKAAQEKAQAESKRQYEMAQAQQQYMMMMLPFNLMGMPDEMVKTISGIVPAFDANKDYPEKSVIKFEDKNYRAKSAVQANDLTPDKNDKWYEVK